MFFDPATLISENTPPANFANPANLRAPEPETAAEISRISEISSPPGTETEGDISKISEISSPPACEKIGDPDDNRRTCNDCTELHQGQCRAAARGELPHAARRYEPIADRLHRCLSYRPGPEDTDRRTGRERYPGMARKAATAMEAAA